MLHVLHCVDVSRRVHILLPDLTSALRLNYNEAMTCLPLFLKSIWICERCIRQWGTYQTKWCNHSYLSQHICLVSPCEIHWECVWVGEHFLGLSEDGKSDRCQRHDIVQDIRVSCPSVGTGSCRTPWHPRTPAQKPCVFLTRELACHWVAFFIKLSRATRRRRASMGRPVRVPRGASHCTNGSWMEQLCLAGNSVMQWRLPWSHLYYCR